MVNSNKAKSLSLSIPAPAINISNIDNYIRTVNGYPILSLDEERTLFREIKKNNRQALTFFILCHLRLVIHISRHFLGYGLAHSDLIQEGNIGLLKAVPKYKMELGVRFSSFASHWIKSEIYEYIIRNWKLVKIATTKNQRKLFFNLRKIEHQLEPNETLEEKLVTTLEVPLKDVRLMKERMHVHDHSFEQIEDLANQVSSENKPAGTRVMALIDPQSNFSQQIEEYQWKEYLNHHLKEALHPLPERSQQIITARWLQVPKENLTKLATLHKISIERVRQIEQKAIKQIRDYFAKQTSRIVLSAREKGAATLLPSKRTRPKLPVSFAR